jgi:phage terminase large subunit
LTDTQKRQVELDYAPRRVFLPFHYRTQRWAVLVAHRRAGKTVATVNDLIARALSEKKRDGLYGFIAPYRQQGGEAGEGHARQWPARRHRSRLIMLMSTA